MGYGIRDAVVRNVIIDNDRIIIQPKEAVVFIIVGKLKFSINYTNTLVFSNPFRINRRTRKRILFN